MSEITNRQEHDLSRQTSDISKHSSQPFNKEQQNDTQPSMMPLHKTAMMMDERYAITSQESESILKRYFKEGLDGRLSEFPRKEKRKIIILHHLVQRFERGRQYTEQEVNEQLAAAFDDYATLRRYLIIYGLMDRQEDGRAYWVKE